MPGPGPTLSRCAPTTITLFGSPSRVSAITFDVGYVPGRQSIFRRAVNRSHPSRRRWPARPRSQPPATDGIEIPVTLIHVPAGRVEEEDRARAELLRAEELRG